VVGPSIWNSLPDSLRDPELSLDTFKRQLKTYIFAKYWWQNVLSALEIFLSMRYINLHFTYLLTYLAKPFRGKDYNFLVIELSSRSKTVLEDTIAGCDIQKFTWWSRHSLTWCSVHQTVTENPFVLLWFQMSDVLANLCLVNTFPFFPFSFFRSRPL